MTKRITQAAIVDEDGTLWTLPAPARHHHILRAITAALKAAGEDPRVMQAAQGFIAKSGPRSWYVSRSSAYRIAKAAGQLIRGTDGYQGTDLFSEDLW